jgi:hypothetical protein
MALKKTHLYKVIFKPGTFAAIGERNKIGNLYLERAIGDWLVAKGIAETDDNCVYTLSCCGGDTTLSYDQETGDLCITVDSVEQCVTLLIPITNVITTTTITIDGTDYPPGTDLNTIITNLITYINSLVISTVITTTNGLSGTGSVLNPAKLGGTLIENTTVDGAYNMSFTNLTQFLVTVLGASANSTLRVSGAQSLPTFLSHVKTTDANVYARLELDFNDVFGLNYLDGNGLIGFRIFPDETDVSNDLGLRTKGIRDATKVAGMVPVLTDAVEGIFEWDYQQFPGPYDDDTAAGVAGIAIGQAYELSAANPYGMPEGMVKVRRS